MVDSVADDAATETAATPGEPGSSSGPSPGTSASSSAGDPGTTSSDYDSSSDSGDGLDDPRTEVRHTTYPCEQPDVLAAVLSGPTPYLAATVLEPPVYPFEVQTIVYELAGEAYTAGCDSTLPHRVQLFVVSADEPPRDPDQDAERSESFELPPEPERPNQRKVVLDLEDPIVLEDEQRLVVAVEMITGPQETSGLCLLACADGGGDEEADWSSDGATPPLTWSDMVEDRGRSSNLEVRALGYGR